MRKQANDSDVRWILTPMGIPVNLLKRERWDLIWHFPYLKAFRASIRCVSGKWTKNVVNGSWKRNRMNWPIRWRMLITNWFWRENCSILLWNKAGWAKGIWNRQRSSWNWDWNQLPIYRRWKHAGREIFIVISRAKIAVGSLYCIWNN